MIHYSTILCGVYSHPVAVHSSHVTGTLCSLVIAGFVLEPLCLGRDADYLSAASQEIFSWRLPYTPRVREWAAEEDKRGRDAENVAQFLELTVSEKKNAPCGQELLPLPINPSDMSGICCVGGPRQQLRSHARQRFGEVSHASFGIWTPYPSQNDTNEQA